MTLFCCCLEPIIIRSVLSGLHFNLLDSIQNKMSVRQLVKVETYSLHLIVKVICKYVLSSAYRI